MTDRTKGLIVMGIVAFVIGLTSCTTPAATHQDGTSRAAATQETSTPRPTAPPMVTPRTQIQIPNPSDLDPTTYQSIPARDFAILTKNPDSATGRKIVIYGSVTQADTATGSKAFRATVMGKPHADHAYQINSVIMADNPTIIANVVEGDQVTMWVKVGGSFTYDTQFGGKQTVPLFLVNIINVTAHIDR